MCVVGSSDMFSLDYIEIESNKAFLVSLTNHLIEPDLSLPTLQVPIREYRFISDLTSLSEKPFCCWQDLLDPIPDDIMSLVDRRVYDGGVGLLEDVKKSYELLGIEFKPLKGPIKPAYHVPKFDLIPVIPLPSLRPLLQPPPLELVDIDELLDPPEIRLNRIANECEQAGDIERFISDSAKAVDLSEEIGDPKEIMKNICRKIFA
jgi:hypothetical protein